MSDLDNNSNINPFEDNDDDDDDDDGNGGGDPPVETLSVPTVSDSGDSLVASAVEAAGNEHAGKTSAEILAESKELLDDEIHNAVLASLDGTDEQGALTPKKESKTATSTAKSTRSKPSASNSTETTATTPEAKQQQQQQQTPSAPRALNRAETVSVERKEELLLEARVNRLQWIHRVPLPYRMAESPDDPWVQQEGLAKFLKTCHAAALMPSMTKVLSHLYGMEDHRVAPEEVANRIDTLLGSFDDRDSPHSFVRPGKQLLEAEIAKNEGDEVLTGYREFWIKLQTPECASLVQGLRTAIRNLDDVDEPRTSEEIAERLKSYLAGTFESVKYHPAWKKDIVNDRVKHSLESFIYGQCYSLLQSALATDETKKAEKEWMSRLEALQFVTASHLDIACLTDSEDAALDDILAEPMKALTSIDLYYSPYEKLQRVLTVYHGVNKALKEALNKVKKQGESEKLPSADDVLPTIILTVLRARPARILTNLQMVELFSPPEYLRGEAGYAFTNLYGAVQFLQDLDMEDPKSLSISKEEFKKGLADSRAKFKQRLEAQKKRAEFQGPKIDTDISLKFADIPASEIRAARDRGEIVDLNWALEWRKAKLDAEMPPTSAAGQSTSQERSSAAEDILPQGFSRNYTFLTARPEDIRISDLPQLLSEYRMLVHSTETLLGERASKLSAERKKKVSIAQEELLANAREIDPTLLPEHTGRYV